MDNGNEVAVMERDEVNVPERLPAVEEGGAFELSKIENPTAAIEVAERLVKKMADKCSGPEYIAPIQGKRYPKVEWWTTVGASLGLFPREESNKRLDREDEIAYEANVAVYRGDQLITRASAICSSKESTWSGRDEYAIRSMAATRATAKAFRIGLSFLATLAGLEATPAEEVPSGGFTDDRPFDLDDEVGFGKHKDLTWRQLAHEQPGYIKWLRDETDKLTPDMLKVLRQAVAAEGPVDVDTLEGDMPELGLTPVGEDHSIGRLEVLAGIGVKDREAIFERLDIEDAGDDPDAYAAELRRIIDTRQEQEA